jgi:hypothetical protein
MQSFEIAHATVMSHPQIGFPFPGMPEVNIICRIKNGGMNELVGVVLYNAEVPRLGQEIEVVKYGDFYHDQESEISRYCYPAPAVLETLKGHATK